MANDLLNSFLRMVQMPESQLCAAAFIALAAIGFLFYYFTEGIIYRSSPAADGRLVRDLPLAYRYAIYPLLPIFLMANVFWYYTALLFLANPAAKWWTLMAALLVFILGFSIAQSVSIWRSYNFGIYVSGKRDLIDIPATDQEVSAIEVLMMNTFFDRARRESLKLSEIDQIDNDSTREKGKRRFCLTISGEFGSRSLEFSCKQKRDECRSAIISQMRKFGISVARKDWNMDIYS